MKKSGGIKSWGFRNNGAWEIDPPSVKILNGLSGLDGMGFQTWCPCRSQCTWEGPVNFLSLSLYIIGLNSKRHGCFMLVSNPFFWGVYIFVSGMWGDRLGAKAANIS